MPAETHVLTVDNTQDITFVYNTPLGALNWGVDLTGSDLEQDASTPLVLFLHDFPGCDKNSHFDMFAGLAAELEKLGVPSLALDYRGAGDTDIYSAHFSFNTALRDIECALKWAISEHKFTKIMPVACGVSAPIILSFIEKHKLTNEDAKISYKKERASFDTTHNALAKERAAASRADVSSLRLLSLALFWPILEPRKNDLLALREDDTEQKSDIFDNVQAGDFGFEASIEAEPAFTGMPVSSDMKVYTDEKDHNIGLIFINDLEKSQPLPILQKMTCPLLVQQGTEDKNAPASQLDALRQHNSSRYLDIQVYQGGERGLEDKAFRPTLERVSVDFIKKFV